jgi:hypothetical protein
LLDSLIEALGGEMELGAEAAPTQTQPTAVTEAADDDPPF